ncbi:MAG: CHASE2 domain-containing protein [Burkholderiaceae bacterium]
MATDKNRPQWLSGLAVAVAAAVLASGLTWGLAFLNSLEKVAADIRLAAFQPPQPQSESIVVAAITEETLASFPYRSPVDRAFLASLLETLQDKGAKAIGLDILLDQPTEPEKDELLAQTLRSMRIPVFVSYTVTPSVVNEDQLAYLNAFVPEPLRAAANLATDPFDGSVRWIFPGETEPGMPVSFARKAAEVYGVQTQSQPLAIAWRPRPDPDTLPFRVFPAHAAAVLPADWFAGKLVLIGAVVSITDRHRTPLAVVRDDDDGNMPGILVQAHAADQLITSRAAPEISFTSMLGVGLLLSLIGMALGLAKRGILFSVVSGLVVVVVFWVGGLWGYAYGLALIPLVAPTLALALSLWMMDALIGRAERRQRQFVQGAFSRYVSPAVVSQLVENPDALRITGTRQEASFIFTDIAGFTTLSEGLTSEALSEVLNSYLDGACSIVFAHGGTVDKFIGDAIMAIFNAPIAQADHAERAVRCALALDAYAEDFRKAKNAQGVPLGVTRIGVHSGQATIGNFGSNARMDFTALGDTVNTAARTEGVNKYFGTRVCCTQEIVDRCPGLAFLPIGDVFLKGKQNAVTLYSPVSDAQQASGYAKDYGAAYSLLIAGKVSQQEIQHQFSELLLHYPEEPLARFHADRIAQGLVSTKIVMEDK